GARAGVAAEDEVERLVEGRGEADPVAEGDQHHLQQRVLGATARGGGLQVHRLDVEQAAADGQREQVAVDHLGVARLQQVQRLRDVRLRIEGRLHLAGTVDRVRSRQ